MAATSDETGGVRVEPSVRVTGDSELGLTKFLDPLRIPPVIRAPDGSRRRLQITQSAAKTQLHSQLPPTPVWTYEGSFPGPTIEVRRGQQLDVI